MFRVGLCLQVRPSPWFADGIAVLKIGDSEFKRLQRGAKQRGNGTLSSFAGEALCKFHLSQKVLHHPGDLVLRSKVHTRAAIPVRPGLALRCAEDDAARVLPDEIPDDAPDGLNKAGDESRGNEHAADAEYADFSQEQVVVIRAHEQCIRDDRGGQRHNCGVPPSEEDRRKQEGRNVGDGLAPHYHAVYGSADQGRDGHGADGAGERPDARHGWFHETVSQRVDAVQGPLPGLSFSLGILDAKLRHILVILPYATSSLASGQTASSLSGLTRSPPRAFKD